VSAGSCCFSIRTSYGRTPSPFPYTTLFRSRTMSGMAAVPALILFLGSLNLPGSPRYLVRNDRIDEARQVLQLVQPCAQAEKEIRSEEHTSELQPRIELVRRLHVEKTTVNPC